MKTLVNSLNLSKFFLILIGAVAFSTSYAWSTAGHMLIAQVAYDYLEPTVRKEVNDLIHVLSHEYPKSSHFMSAAAWADDLKRDGVSAFNAWHFVDFPIGHRAIPTRENVIWAINQSGDVLLNPDASNMEKAMFLRFLIHFVGDVHQPLHCASFYSDRFPEGDLGGNLYTINEKHSHTLHRYWDGGLGYFKNALKRSRPSREVLKEVARKIEAEFPKSKFAGEIEDVEPMHWAEESHGIARDFVYLLPEHGTPEQDYIQNGQQIAKARVALAGYRLAYLLNAMYVQQH